VRSVDRHAPLPPGAWVIARDADHRDRLGARQLGPPLVVGAGRLGNLGRGWLVLAQAPAEGG